MTQKLATCVHKHPHPALPAQAMPPSAGTRAPSHTVMRLTDGTGKVLSPDGYVFADPKL